MASSCSIPSLAMRALGEFRRGRIRPLCVCCSTWLLYATCVAWPTDAVHKYENVNAEQTLDRAQGRARAPVRKNATAPPRTRCRRCRWSPAPGHHGRTRRSARVAYPRRHNRVRGFMPVPPSIVVRHPFDGRITPPGGCGPVSRRNRPVHRDRDQQRSAPQPSAPDSPSPPQRRGGRGVRPRRSGEGAGG